MADSILIPYSGQRIFNTNGGLASGAKIFVYDTGTADLHNIFTDNTLLTAASNPVVCDSNGLCPYIYVGTTDYKLVVQTSGNSALDTENAVRGATDTSDLSTDFAKTDSDISAKSDDYTMLAADLGTTLSVNPSATTKTITLMSAVTATNGRGITIIYSGTSGTVAIATVSSQTITRENGAPTSMSLTAQGESVELRSDGANWLAVSETGNDSPITTQGDLITNDGTTNTRLAVGSANQILQSDGTDPSWGNLAASDTVAGLLEVAVQSEMEAASSATLAVTPGRQHFHPGHPKAYVTFELVSVGGSIDENYGVASINDEGSGDTTITFDTAFSAVTYAAAGMQGPDTDDRVHGVKQQAAFAVGAARVITSTASEGSTSYTNLAYNAVIFLGDH